MPDSNDGTPTTGVTQDQVSTDDQNQEEVTSDTTETQIDPLAELEKLQLDPKVKEALKSGYMMQSDYTKKTQELSDRRKELDEYQVFKPYIDKVFADPELYKQVFGQRQDQTQNQTQQEEYPQDPKAYADWVIQKAVEQSESKIRASMEEERDLDEASKIDPRLNEDQEYAEIIAGIMAQDQQFVQRQKTAVQATKDAITKYNAYFNRVKGSVKQDFVEKAKQKRMVTPSGGSPVGTGFTKPTTMQEAAKMAEEELAR